jgi:hypothetical protein
MAFGIAYGSMRSLLTTVQSNDDQISLEKLEAEGEALKAIMEGLMAYKSLEDAIDKKTPIPPHF